MSSSSPGPTPRPPAMAGPDPVTTRRDDEHAQEATRPGRELARIDATVTGRVQGVGFRWFVLDAARRLELRGWVANAFDGSVRCVAEGPRGDLEALVAELEHGPSGARVDRVVPRWGRAAGGLADFEIRSGAHPGD
jgi:acylphosphatase